MTTLAHDKPRAFQLGELEDYPVAGGARIYEGAAVGEDDAGAVQPLQAGGRFLGFAERGSNNVDGAAGATSVRVRTRGRVQLPIAGLTVAANSRPAVYASDDDTFTLSATGNSLIGYVSRFVDAGIAIVEFDAALVGAALHA